MLDNSCAFTGHRPHKLPWKYNEADSRCVALKTVLMEQITKLTEAGMTDFYSLSFRIFSIRHNSD